MSASSAPASTRQRVLGPPDNTAHDGHCCQPRGCVFCLLFIGWIRKPDDVSAKMASNAAQVANLPLLAIHAKVAHGKKHTLWCVLDTGAAGTNLMLSQPAAVDLGFLQTPDVAAVDQGTMTRQAGCGDDEREVTPSHRSNGCDRGVADVARNSGNDQGAHAADALVNVRGVTSVRNPMQAAHVESLLVGQHTFGRQQVLFTADKAAMQTSVYGSSLACMGLLGNFRIVLDVRHRRVAFREEADGSDL
jgi:hypothetical protein